MRVIHITVDLTEASRNLIHTRVQLPVQPGVVAIFTTPLWVQESHRDNGPVAGIAGLHFSSGSKTLPWRRNPKVVSEYQVEVPSDVDTVYASFDAIITSKVTRRMAMLGWEHVLLYPAHRHVEKIRIQASVAVPRGWGVGTALENLGRPIITYTADGSVKTLLYQPTSVERLADSPILTGLHFGEFTVTTDQRHVLCVAADTKEYAVVPQDTLDKLARLVTQTWAVFGARHYETFWFLLELTDHWTQYGGSEHHDSFDVSLPRKALSDAENLDQFGMVITHEFVHSWNGKYRRPAGHVPHDFATPLDGRLLWVYEGLTQYYHGVLSVRCGLMSPGTYRAELANIGAWLEGRAGRLWRSTEDTGTGSSLRGSTMWANWTRTSQDYYNEGTLIWLDVDTAIRTITGGKRSLDDFAKGFFGQGRITGPEVVPYTLGELVSDLNTVAPNDWRALFETKVQDVAPRINVDGIERAGYRFVYTDEPGVGQDKESDTHGAIWNSIGLKVGEGGQLQDVRRGGPADIAKLAPRQTITKVGDASFSLNTLVAEIGSKRQNSNDLIRLTVTQEGEEWGVELDYHGGLRYPRLVRRASQSDMLFAILAEKSIDN